MVKNGNLRFILLGIIFTDQLADIPPLQAFNGEEWQFEIYTV